MLLLSNVQQEPVVFPTFIGWPTISGGNVYFGSLTGPVYAYEMATGKKLWEFKKVGQTLMQPTVHNDLVFVGGMDGILNALDRKTGEERWSFKAGEVEWKYRDKFINGKPRVYEDRVIFSSEDFNIYALDVKTGEEIWRTNLGEEPQSLDIPLVDGGLLIGTWAGHLYSVDLMDGHIRWSSQTSFSPKGVTQGVQYVLAEGEDKWLKPSQLPFMTVVPAYDDSRIYTARWSGELIALDRKTGREVWNYRPDTSAKRHVGSRGYVFLHGETVIYGTEDDKTILGVNKNSGELMWSDKRARMIYGPYPCDDQSVIFAERGLGGLLTLLQYDTAKHEVVRKITDAAMGISVVDGVGYYGTKSRQLVGMNMKTGEKVWTLKNTP